MGYDANTVKKDDKLYRQGHADAKAGKQRDPSMTYASHSMYHHGYDDASKGHEIQNSTPFTNGRNKALAEIGARYPEKK